MADVTIYGASDDLIEVEGDVPGCDEYGGAVGTFVVAGALGPEVKAAASALGLPVKAFATRVHIGFGPLGVWSVALSPLDEDTPVLPATVDSERYTARATFRDVSLVIQEPVAGDGSE